MNLLDVKSFIANCSDEEWNELNLAVFNRKRNLEKVRVTSYKVKKALELVRHSKPVSVIKELVGEEMYCYLEEKGYIIPVKGKVVIV